MAKKLYVGGLSYGTTEDALREYFSAAGTVDSAMIIIDKMSGRSKGFGFVDMNDDTHALAAIKKLTNAEFFGRKLVVSKARPKTTTY